MRLVQKVLDYLHWKTKKELDSCVRNDKYIRYILGREKELTAWSLKVASSLMILWFHGTFLYTTELRVLILAVQNSFLRNDIIFFYYLLSL